MNRQLIIGVLFMCICALSQAQQRSSAEIAKVRNNNKDVANSGEITSAERNQVLKIKDDEKFIPSFVPKGVGTSSSSTEVDCDVKSRYRTIDGSCNNIDHPEWGKPNSTYVVRLPPVFGDGKRDPRRGFNKNPLPGARRLRTELFPTGAKENKLWNVNAMIWGQFVAHDMSLLSDPKEPFACCTKDGNYVKSNSKFCFPIKVPKDDPTMGRAGISCLNFSRTLTDKDFGFGEPNEPAKQINTVTPYMDLSNVYGLSKQMSDRLRSFRRGKLAVEVRNNHIFPPRERSLKDFCPCNKRGEKTCYKTGDSRSNQNPELAIMQILFVREHNRICDELNDLNPHWNDERLFQEARRILIAMYQRIHYYEWMPIFMGRKNLMNANIIVNETLVDYVDDYDPKEEPGVYNEHAHGGFRHFHTHVVGQLKKMDEQRRTTSTFSLSRWFGRPNIIESNPFNVEEITIGMLMQNLEETDNTYVEDITDKFFACGRDFGIDLKAADIQRDRDHGLAYYNDYRVSCGLPEAKSFDDYSDVIPKEDIEKLKELYEDYRDVDTNVGGSLERLAPDAQFGPTFLCLVMDQFQRTRATDRFWYEHTAAGFTKEQLREIRKATMSRMYCDSGDGVTRMQPFGFTLLFPFNQLKPCRDIPSMSLEPWREDFPMDM